MLIKLRNLYWRASVCLGACLMASPAFAGGLDFGGDFLKGIFDGPRRMMSGQGTWLVDIALLCAAMWLGFRRHAGFKAGACILGICCWTWIRARMLVV